MQTGTIFSGIGHAGLILWVLVGDWLFPVRPPEEIIATQVSLLTSEEFAALPGFALLRLAYVALGYAERLEAQAIL